MKHIKYIAAILLAWILTHGLMAQNDYITDTNYYTGKAEVTARVQVRLLPGFQAAKGSDVHVYIDSNALYPNVDYDEDQGSTPGNITLSTANNFIRTYQLREPYTYTTEDPGTKQRIETIQYFDGLGRLAQTVKLEGSPSNEDIVVPVVYDGYGREKGKYLPFIESSNNGAFVSDADQACIEYYDITVPAGRISDERPFSATIYEDSPLNRVLGETGIGENWQSNPTSVSYLTNSSIDSWDETGAQVNFPANSLYMTQYEDEDSHQTREYKDKLGRVVLKEAYDGSNWLQTFYVYDDFGLLRTVVPPLASSPGSYGSSELCYYYLYDARKRMVEKKLPGAEVVYMVYDERDRLVMVQEGVLRADGIWLATFYDELNRQAMTAKVWAGSSRSIVQGNFDSFVGEVEQSASGSEFGFVTTDALPTAYNLDKGNILTATYYDDRYFLDAPDFSSEDYGFGDYDDTDFTTASTGMLKGFQTGSFTRVIDNAMGGEGDNLLLSVMYYDEYGNVIRSIADNHRGGKDVSYSKFYFDGQPEKTAIRHNAVLETSEDAKVNTYYTYDHQGRMLTEKVQMDDDDIFTTVANTYNELGEVVEKYLHGDESKQYFNQVVDYAYNTRGWLRNINTLNDLETDGDLFALDLRYQNPTAGGLTADALYNGNISEIMWQTINDNTSKGYGFTYDGLNRISSADYAEGTSYADNVDAYNTSYTYDDNGNLMTLTRKMASNPIDGLVYTYMNGTNKLQSVTDNGTDAGYKAVAGNYQYDVNGNMTTDPSKAATITYNHLNLPENVLIGNDNVDYYYAANGTKLRKYTHGDDPENENTTDYIGPFVYGNNQLKCIFTSEGRIVRFDIDNNVLYKYEYNLKDHLGNTRVVFAGHGNGKPELMQTTGYYPFGLTMEQNNHFAETELANNYLYNGKEIQNDDFGTTSLGWYDYGARFYDPELGRWHVIDPNASKYVEYSPYNYVYNNPINAIDPDGRDGIVIVFPDYKIQAYGRKWKNLGHAGVLLINNKSGTTKYFEYGRYDEANLGRVMDRSKDVSNVVMGKDGRPTSKSLEKVLGQISKISGDGTRIEGAYIKSDQFGKMLDYAKSRQSDNNNPDREPYSIWTNNCGTFASDVVKQDENVGELAPGIIDPRPNSIIGEYQDVFDKVTYDSKGGVKYTVNKKYHQQFLNMLKQQQKKKDEDENN